MEDNNPPAVITQPNRTLDYVKLAVWVLTLAAVVGTFVVQVVRGEKPAAPDLPPPPPFVLVVNTGSPGNVSTSPVVPASTPGK